MIFELTWGSNLSGPFYLFRPVSASGQLIARIVRPAPYLNMGPAWMLNKKYEGTGSRKQYRRMLSNTHSPTEFATAGQDAIALVKFLCTIWEGWNSNRQIRRLPHFLCRSVLYTLQMLPLLKYVIFIELVDPGPQLSYLGGYPFTCQISQALTTIRGTGRLRKEHCGFRRRGLEEVPKDCRSGILRGTF